MRRRQRGFSTLLVYGLVALGILTALGTLHHVVFQSGVDHERSAQAVRDAEAEEHRKRRRIANVKTGNEAAARIRVADEAAADYYAAWRATSAANREPLATCLPANPPPSGAPVMVGGAPAADRNGIVLTPSFVLQWDAAWTDAGGKPVFADTGIVAGEAGATATPAQALANHGENAARCSATARRYNALIDLLLKLRGG